MTYSFIRELWPRTVYVRTQANSEANPRHDTFEPLSRFAMADGDASYFSGPLQLIQIDDDGKCHLQVACLKSGVHDAASSCSFEVLHPGRSALQSPRFFNCT